MDKENDYQYQYSNTFEEHNFMRIMDLCAKDENGSIVNITGQVVSKSKRPIADIFY